jgi:hypothetical protein
MFVKYKCNDFILFLDIDSTPHNITALNELKEFNTLNIDSKGRRIKSQSYLPRVQYDYIAEKVYYYIDKFNILKITKSNNETSIEVVKTFAKELKSRPYSYTGTEEVYEGIYHSPINPFIAWANIALIEHRTFRAVSSLYAYPRMIESESACDEAGCMTGIVECAITEENPTGKEPCKRCKGTGKLSLQSPYNIYKFKQDENNPNALNIKPVIEFITPDIGILEYNSKAYLQSLAKAEEALYIQQNKQTGNVESAKARELQLSEMYAWLNRLADYFYSNLKDSIQILHEMEGASEMVSIEKPISFAILNELEAFELLQSIVNSAAPNILKSSQIEGFLNKYTSKSNPLIKQMEVLKNVDPFVFYSNNDFEAQYGSNLINEEMAFTHVNAYPLLSRMIAIEPELLKADTPYIVKKLNEEINKIMPKNPLKEKVNIALGV